MTQNVLDSIPVRLGPLEFDLLTDQPQTRAVLLDRFRGFVRPDSSPRQALMIGREPPHEYRGVKIEEPEFSLDYFAGGHSRIRVGAVSEASIEDPLITALLHFVSLQAIDNGALLVHAGAVVLNERAVVFPGHSGIGKSTLAGMFEAEDVLNDEFVLLDTATATCASTPFFGTSMPERRGTWRSCPLGGFLHLQKTQRPEVAERSAAEGFRQLLSAISVPAATAEYQTRAFAHATVAQSSPWFSFGFPLDAAQTIRALTQLVS